jgi:C1A family cysteine protease
MLAGANQMKAEIYMNGPLSCGMYLSPNLIVNYTGDIYSEKIDDVEDLMNHEVSVVGYGKDPKSGTEYWVVRNTQGTNWGDYGYLYL